MIDRGARPGSRADGFAGLDARGVGETAERAFLSLPFARDAAFGSVYSYLVVDEPAVHLMPLHFCPAEARRSVGVDALHALGVAAKLEYARSRWVDEVVDAGGGASLTSVHRLHDALLALVNDHYSEALGDTASSFVPTLADLHARHAMSLALDGAPARGAQRALDFEEYVEHARARHGPCRAPVDAVLLLAGASADVLQKATASWHSWALGVQLYDDAVDVEEDFGARNRSWTVWRALGDMKRGMGPADASAADSEAFYEMALSRGAIFETLRRAEAFFRDAARTSEGRFPSWVSVQRACINQTRRLREDLQALSPGSGST